MNEENINSKLYLDWQVGYSNCKGIRPTIFIPSEVPGAVQLDIAKFENYPDYNYSDNYKLFKWMEDKFYTYRTVFDKPKLENYQQLWFVSKGIDYQFEISLNNIIIHKQEGMFSHVKIKLANVKDKENVLEILIFPVPKRFPFPEDRTQASNVTKPAVSYLWDWHPRLIPLGIWDDTYLEICYSSHINDVYVNYELSDDFNTAEIVLDVNLELNSDCTYKWELIDRDGEIIICLGGIANEQFSMNSIIKTPNLWWTHDHGTPYLYTSIFTLLSKEKEVVDIQESKIGFRRFRLVMNEGGWDEPLGFPKSRSVSPAQIELNGQNIFAKGTNWVNPEIFPGLITKERYNELIQLAINSNFNILRTWGGAIVNKDSFFDLCDELGIIVWQEFPLACNLYPDDKHYLSILEQEATFIVKKLRKHASIGIWCGGNELFNSWSKMTDQSLPLRLLNKICYTYDPLTPFNPTSPLLGMAHGHYLFKWEGSEVYEMMDKSHYTAYSEFGMPGISPREVLEKIIPEKDLFPPKAGTAWEEHHAFGAWDGDLSTWLCHEMLTDYMGEAQSLDELIDQSNLLQIEGYKAIFEEARRQKPYCAMALNWCFNEPWPTAANNSLVAYPNIAKPALQAVTNSCRQFCSSAKITKLVWTEGEMFFADIWLLNDQLSKVGPKMLIVKINTGVYEVEILKWKSPVIEKNRNLAGPTVRFLLPKWDVKFFKLIVEVENHPEYNSEYTLIYQEKEFQSQITASMNLDS